MFSIPCETSVLFDQYVVNKRIVHCGNEDFSNTLTFPSNLALAVHLTNNVSKFYLHAQFERSQMLENNLKALNKNMISTLTVMNNKTIDLREVADILIKNNSDFS